MDDLVEVKIEPSENEELANHNISAVTSNGRKEGKRKRGEEDEQSLGWKIEVVGIMNGTLEMLAL